MFIRANYLVLYWVENLDGDDVSWWKATILQWYLFLKEEIPLRIFLGFSSVLFKSYFI